MNKNIPMKKVFYLFSVLLFFSCSDKNSPNEGFELKGNLTNGNGAAIYLEQLSNEGATTIDSALIDDKGEFTLNTELPEPGFYNLKVSESSFATLILDSLQKVTVSGDAGDLGNTYKVSGSEDSQLFWEVNEISKNNYHKRDSLQKVFQSQLNSQNPDQKTIDSLDKAIGFNFDLLVESHNKYLVNFVEQHLSSFASLVAIQQLDEAEYSRYYVMLDSALSAKYPNSMYVKLFHERSSQKAN